MDNQEIATRIITHLRQQGRRSENEDNCLYLSPNGDKCAAGCLIPEKDYRPDFEGHTLSTISIDSMSFGTVRPIDEYFQAKYSMAQIRLIREFQRIHDESLPPTWEESWEKLARQWGLQMPPGNKLSI